LLSTGEPDDPQTWNRYVYALNSPLYYTDPTGLYVCKGNEEQCKQFAARLAEGKEYLKKVGDKYGVDSDKYKQVSNALNAYGEDETGKDKNNGVFVSFDRKKGGGNTEGTFDKDGKLTGINVSLNASDLKNKNSFHAVVGHEGDHVNYFQTVGNNTNDKRNFEYGGHFVQSLLGEAQFGQFANGRYWATDDNAKQYDIWNSSWEGPDRETLRTSAINKWLDVPTNQGGYGPNPPPPPKPKPTRQRRKKG